MSASEAAEAIKLGNPTWRSRSKRRLRRRSSPARRALAQAWSKIRRSSVRTRAGGLCNRRGAGWIRGSWKNARPAPRERSRKDPGRPRGRTRTSLRPTPGPGSSAGGRSNRPRARPGVRSARRAVLRQDACQGPGSPIDEPASSAQRLSPRAEGETQPPRRCPPRAMELERPEPAALPARVPLRGRSPGSSRRPPDPLPGAYSGRLRCRTPP
jgi:hypothetical protein